MSDSQRPNFTAVILAAGKGTRMNSALPKTLHALAGRPMLGHVLATAQAAGATQICLVTAPTQDDIRDFADAHARGGADTQNAVVHCIQAEQKGTGDAVQVALPHCDNERIVVLFGDSPLMRPHVLSALACPPDNNAADIVVMGFVPDDAARYGRIIMNGDNPSEIIEYKDADEATRQVRLCNGGAMGVRRDVLAAVLPKLNNDNAAGEYYLPHVVGVGVANGFSTALTMAETEDTLGVDSRAALAHAEAVMQTRLRAKHLQAGVTMQDPASVFLSHDTKIAPDVVLEPHIKINPGVSIGEGSHIKAFSHLEGVHIGAHVQIGPFARLRPNTTIGDHARIGNFVEVKKSTIGEGSKINHLSYVGDAEVGAHVNIGAGVITCNYDGTDKHITQIEEGAFIGSNTALVAPIKIGKHAYVGSGSALSKDVAAESLVVTRAPAREIPQWANKRASRQKKKD